MSSRCNCGSCSTRNAKEFTVNPDGSITKHTLPEGTEVFLLSGPVENLGASLSVQDVVQKRFRMRWGLANPIDIEHKKITLFELCSSFKPTSVPDDQEPPADSFSPVVEVRDKFIEALLDTSLTGVWPSPTQKLQQRTRMVRMDKILITDDALQSNIFDWMRCDDSSFMFVLNSIASTDRTAHAILTAPLDSGLRLDCVTNEWDVPSEEDGSTWTVIRPVLRYHVEPEAGVDYDWPGVTEKDSLMLGTRAALAVRSYTEDAVSAVPCTVLVDFTSMVIVNGHRETINYLQDVYIPFLVDYLKTWSIDDLNFMLVLPVADGESHMVNKWPTSCNILRMYL